MTDWCVFCDIQRDPDARIVRVWRDAVAFVPLNPVVEGHVLVVPFRHVQDASEDPKVTAATFRRASELAREVGSCNLITSVGKPATQSIFHLHVHVVPRSEGDGLTLPWTEAA